MLLRQCLGHCPVLGLLLEVAQEAEQGKAGAHHLPSALNSHL